jgi:hypothetical protein
LVQGLLSLQLWHCLPLAPQASSFCVPSMQPPLALQQFEPTQQRESLPSMSMQQAPSMPSGEVHLLPLAWGV